MTALLWTPVPCLPSGWVRFEATETERLCDNGASLRSRGISTPEAQSHRLTQPPVGPADPRTGRGLVVRGSDE